ncbi:hypothetical protein EDB92DRAFT_1820817 [Lactarius akahatsu]|uniref:Transmembrane protein n=1 Tax=Lactarius akahatsu TaxID=416441 RepID=A0AAD4L4P4_9AGAM|nr:hypothetical protein EDB92DRAFT_1820817 [Lactarius akahatsu]
MQPRTPSLAILTSLILLAARCLVVAQIMGPDCNLSWEWTFNTLGQVFTIDELQPGNSYTGSDSVDDCQCNIVTYNLLSVCDACQGAYWSNWSDYSLDCTSGLSPFKFPNPVPPGTRVPQWALLDSTVRSPICTFPKPSLAGAPFFRSREIGIPPRLFPEIEPGSFISTPASGSEIFAPSDPPPEDLSPLPSESESGPNTGAIAGGISGGVVALAALGALLFYFLRKRQRSRAPSAMFDGWTPPMNQEHPPQSVPKKPAAPMRLYDPNDPRTFPKYQRVPTPAQDVHDPVLPNDGSPNGNTLTKVQAAPTPGYHGLPIV